MCVQSCLAFYADPLNPGFYICAGDCGSGKCEGFAVAEEEECPEGCPAPYIIWERTELAGKPALSCSATCTTADKPFIENNTCVAACTHGTYQLNSGPPEQ